MWFEQASTSLSRMRFVWADAPSSADRPQGQPNVDDFATDGSRLERPLSASDLERHRQLRRKATAAKRPVIP
jgi:hypothetical protein